MIYIQINKIDASQSIGGSLTITARNKSEIMRGATIKCPPNGLCHINCHADQACSDSIIISDPQTTSLSIVASGDKVLMNANITCPMNIDYGDCFVSVDGDYINMISCINIFAQDSFYDLYLECNNDNPNCYDPTNCNPTIHCNTDHSGSCDMELMTGSVSNWQCISPSINDCSITPYPTSYPTQSPTIWTISPSIHPSLNPTNNPSTNPTMHPTAPPSLGPSNYPSTLPIKSPTTHPTNIPTYYPSSNPTKNPTSTNAFGPTSYPNISWFIDISSTEVIDSTMITSSSPVVTSAINPSGIIYIFHYL